MASSSTDGPSDNRPVSLVSEDAPAELSVVVDELLNSLSNKFANVSNDIFAKMDDMSKRLDSLEATIQANEESKITPTK